jgi:hypothetical protein
MSQSQFQDESRQPIDVNYELRKAAVILGCLGIVAVAGIFGVGCWFMLWIMKAPAAN